MRWLGRLLLEYRGIALAEAQVTAGALTAWPRATEHLSVSAGFAVYCEAKGFKRAAGALDELVEQVSARSREPGSAPVRGP